jgi:group II intron reverse transcriptase/maturase
MSGLTPELPWEGLGEAQEVPRSDEPPPALRATKSPGNEQLLEAMLDRRNLERALKRVEKNRGSSGIDGMTTEELRPYLHVHWKEIRASLLDQTFRPQPVRMHEIPKATGGMRRLGIPTVLDRLVTQALAQVLQPIFDPSFSDFSYAYRPGRSTHDAVRQAWSYVKEGRKLVVEVDLANFFDQVSHDMLMGRLAKKIGDRRILRLIRRYLESGLMVNGVMSERTEGTPQGSPLSPLLANVLLDDVDQELERSGQSFVRYADDIHVYVRSRRAGARAMARLRKLLGKLQLRVNEAKSVVAPASRRSLLGYSFWYHRGEVRLRVAPKSLRRMKDRVREITSRTSGRSMTQVVGKLTSYLRGWRNYFRLAQTNGIFRALDGWIRRRLRMLQLRHWKTVSTIYRKARALGASRELAWSIAQSPRRRWWNSSKRIHQLLPTRYFTQLGLFQLAK